MSFLIYLFLLDVLLQVLDAELHVILQPVLLVELLLHRLPLGELLLQPHPKLGAQLLDAALVIRLLR